MRGVLRGLMRESDRKVDGFAVETENRSVPGGAAAAAAGVDRERVMHNITDIRYYSIYFL